METAEELLKKGLAETGISVSVDTVNRFLHYLNELRRWNKAYNLTALRSDRDVIIKHFFDSLLFLRAFPGTIGDVCDVGSGAGFPGIPIAVICPDIRVTLVEPSRKKYAFLKNMRQILSLNNINILESRIEDVENSQFDIAITRALFTIEEFMAKARHVVSKGGCLIVSKGPRFSEELDKIPASTQVVHIQATLPLTSLQRHLIRITM